MNEQLQTYIDDLGGKHGVLAYLREHTADGKRYVLPTEYLRPEEKLTYPIWKRVMAACRDHRASKAIIRTSERADWTGMVDTMPTSLLEARLLIGRLQASRRVALMRQASEEPELIEYSNAEGSGFDPDKVSISIAPFIAGGQRCVTEHPNQEGVVLKDLRKSGVVRPAFGRQEYEIQEWLRSLGVFPDNIALQIEEGGDERTPKLFQVKDFASIQRATFRIEDGTEGLLDKFEKTGASRAWQRNFGVTGPDGVVLDIIRAGHRGEMINVNGDQEFAFVLRYNSNGLTLMDYHPSMAAYITEDCNFSLSHQNTRFVQSCLRKPKGLARLSLDLNAIPVRSKRARIISDGYCWAVLPA